MPLRSPVTAAVIAAIAAVSLSAAPPSYHPHKPMHKKVVKPYKPYKKVRHHKIHRHYKAVPPHRRPGRVLRHLPAAAFMLGMAGITYHYHSGVFYRHYPHGYVIVRPPVGAIIPALPSGHAIVTLYGRDYYYYDDIYYVRDRDGYRVVDEPHESEEYDEYEENKLGYNPGDLLTTLPEGAVSETIDGVQYYYYDGVYFLPNVQNGKIVFIVVNPR